MAELATIARPYADALFSVSAADLNAASAWVDELAAVAADPQMMQFADNPKISDEQIFGVFSGVIKSDLPDTAKNFLRTLIDNGRLNALPEIAVQFRALKNARSGSSDAVVYSAYPIESAALADVKSLLEKRFGRKLNVSVAIDESLIGGIRAVVGDEVLDTSVKSRLQQMKVALTA